MKKIDFKEIKNQVQEKLKKAKNLKELDGIFTKYLGREGKISLIFESLKSLPKEERVKIGKKANELKFFLEKSIEKKKKGIEEKIKKGIEKKEWIDITQPGKKIEIGHLHPLTQIKKKVEEIFQSMGFEIVEGPEIETEWYNFDALNFPQEHPAREMQDTFFIKQKDWEKLTSQEKLVMRTHTSPVQIRFMKKNQPPLRIIAPGRVFRREAIDAGHEINFHHVEGLMVDKDVSLANFKAIVKEFFKKLLGEEAKIRLRPSFFPFTEPSFEIDVSCLLCHQKGCSICKNSGWVEIMGAGMVHPNVFKNSGLNPKEWQGFAFGVGLDRLAILKYKINDIRLFYSGDLRFLKQF